MTKNGENYEEIGALANNHRLFFQICRSKNLGAAIQEILNSASCHAEFPTLFCEIKDGLFAVQQAALLSNIHVC